MGVSTTTNDATTQTICLTGIKDVKHSGTYPV